MRIVRGLPTAVRGFAALRRRRAADGARWASARTLRDRGEVIARWLEGDIEYCPSSHNGRPDPETEAIAQPLAAANRAGFVTFGSQPGAADHGWRQRAAVQGLAVDIATRDRLQAVARKHGLTVVTGQAGRWTEYWTAVNDSAMTDPTTGEIRERAGHGAIVSKTGVDLLLEDSPNVLAEARAAWQVTIAEPEWSRNDRLIAALDEFSGRTATGDTAQDVRAGGDSAAGLSKEVQEP